MNPDEINAQGSVSWACWGCKTKSGLHWWNGLSVAVCDRPECSKAYSDFLSKQVAEQDAFEAHVREVNGEGAV